MSLDSAALQSHIARAWQASILPRLIDYVRIPNRSPLFDPDWEANGHMERAVELIARWCREQAVPGLDVQIVRRPTLTPLLLADLPGELERIVERRHHRAG